MAHMLVPSSYLPVFSDYDGLPIFITTIAILLSTPVLWFIYTRAKPHLITSLRGLAVLWVLLLTIGAAPIAIIVCFVIAIMGPSNAYHEQQDHMNANLKQKYNATLISPRSSKTQAIYPSNVLTSGDQQYNLSFPNGKSGYYHIKWDARTSEPTIVDPGNPTPAELNQNAANQ